jgi:ABC-type transport system involved in multi-copper enzyme maturation permease subunit
MITIPLTGPRHRILATLRQQALAVRPPQISAVRRLQPLASVLTWELRRYRASRRFWLQAISILCLSFLLIWAQAMSFVYSTQNANGFIAGTSAWGLLMSLPTTVLLLVLFLPFVNADGVTRDLSRRTHELLMTTPLPTWAYVWGRYLIGLMMSLGLAVLLLAAILGMGELLYLTNPDYPPPQAGAVLLLWGGIILPATVLVSSLSFALGTLFPRQSSQIKIGILVVWVFGVEILPLVILSSGQTGLSAWYSDWDPTSAATGLRMLSQFHPDTSQITGAAQLQHLLNTVANKMPDVSTWLAPHLIESLLSFFLVVLVAFAFRRSRSAFSIQ